MSNKDLTNEPASGELATIWLSSSSRKWGAASMPAFRGRCPKLPCHVKAPAPLLGADTKSVLTLLLKLTDTDLERLARRKC